MTINHYIHEQGVNRMLYMPYITMGDPSMESTVDFSVCMIDAGADILELGIPFSDPTADGPIIQAAMDRALQNDMSGSFSMEKIFHTCQKIHSKRSKIPIVLLSYFNSIINGFSFLEIKTETSTQNYKTGVKKNIEFFLQKCQISGVQALVIPDLPYDQMEAEIFRDLYQKYNIAQILMVTPYTSEQRLKGICQAARGWIYYVSSYGVTGIRKDLSFALDIKEKIQKIKELSGLPVFAGFGFHDPKQIQGLHKTVDGIIVGSKNQNIIATKATKKKELAKKELAELTIHFVNACHF